MAVSLTNYRGDPGLGLGSNADIPAIGNPNLDIINQTGNTIMLLDNQRNMDLFKQKIRDRDNLNEMIINDQVATGEILPEYQPYFDAAKKRVEDSFMKWKGNYNDTKGLGAYKKAVQDLKDIAAHGQVNTTEIKKLQQQQAKELLPRKKEELQQWIDKQKKQPFWNQVTPYQQLHDFNMDDILSGVQEFKTEGVDPNNPLYKVDQSYVDYADILRNKRNQYINDMDAADSIDQFFNKIQQYDPAQLGNTIDALNGQLRKYNQDRGLQPGQRGYVEDIKVEPIQGQLLIKEPKTDFAAKYALANRAQFVSRTPKFDKDLAKFAIDKERLAIQAKKLGIDASKAAAYIRHSDAATRKLQGVLQSNGTDIQQMFDDIVNRVKPGGITINDVVKDKKTGLIKQSKKSGNLDAIFLEDIPPAYRYITGPRIDPKTGKVTVEKLEGFKTSDGKEYWVPKYVISETGTEINPRNLPADIQAGYDATNRKRPISVDDYLKALIKQNAIEIIIKGKNGAANINTMFQSAKALNAAGTTKGEENLVNPMLPPESAPEEPE